MKYICYYDVEANKHENRNYVLAATNKIDYILNSMSEVYSDDIEIISPAATKLHNFCMSQNRKINETVNLHLFMSFGRANLFTKLLDYFMIPIQVFIYLLLHTKKGEDVFLYHSVYMILPVLLAKKIKNFHLILEMEEIYSDVTGSRKDKKKELLISEKANAYIFPTKLLDEKLNLKSKKSVVIHGTYQVEKKRNKIFKDNKIHVVYAGTLDPRKGGAIIAALSAQYLKKNYHIHILGFGSNNQIAEIEDIVKKNIDMGFNNLSYEGVLSGEKYITFLQSCDIGLSTQNPTGIYNETSFPSKILSYLANGLRVVSINIEAVKTSKVGDILYYYNNQNPEEIANAINSINLQSKYDSRTIVRKLDESFKKDLLYLKNLE